MKWLALALGALAIAMLWQHVRYLRARRDIVQDRQSMLYSGDSFHVVTFLDAARDRTSSRPSASSVCSSRRRVRRS